MVGNAVRLVAVLGCYSGALLGAPLSMLAQDVAVSTPSETARAATVTVNVDDAPLVVALRRIAQEANLTPFYGPMVENSVARVTLHIKNAPVTEAFGRALEGTGFKATIASGRVVFERDKASAVAAASGVISGKVIDAKTQRPLSGASVRVDDEPRGVRTDENGQFRIASVAAGSHRVTARLLGYSKLEKKATVSDDAAAVLDFSLEASVNALDQVIVTGTVVATELKAVPNAITIITAKDLEQRGITRIDQLFRGDVPGLFALRPTSAAGSVLGQVSMFSRGASKLGAIGNNSNPIKTYIDGIEMADPTFLSQIDPATIERIEILTGPQASTIYGSGAINGVMQVFTKRGSTARPQLSLDVQNGWIENNFSTARTPQHQYNAQLSGIEGRISYMGGLSWNYSGPWAPDQKTTQLDGSGGLSLSQPTPLGMVKADVSYRQAKAQSGYRGVGWQQWDDWLAKGWWGPFPGATSGLGSTQGRYSAQTLGLTLTYTPTTWWSHDIVVGQDASETNSVGNAAQFLSAADTLHSFASTDATRRSLRYATTMRLPMTSFAEGTFTVGGDGWQSMSTSLSASSSKGILSNPYMTRQPTHNSGGFVNGQIGLLDKLFVTYGLRVEWNPEFGKEANPNYAPKYGVVYSTDIGAVTAKLRATYGRSTRPPTIGQKNASTDFDEELNRIYGRAGFYAANPDLGPEYQQGGEGGVELYFGTRASLVVTRYNQTVDQLITPIIGLDSLRSLMPDPVFYGFLSCADFRGDYCSSQDAEGYGYLLQYKNMNASSIRNQGWELQGNVVTGRFTTRGTYSWTKSRVIGLTPTYAAAIKRLGANLSPGASMGVLPEHTFSFGTTYADARTSISFNITGRGQVRMESSQYYWQYLDWRIRLPDNSQNAAGNGWAFTSMTKAAILADFSLSRRFSSRIEGVVNVQNLANDYSREFSPAEATTGRQSRVGVRVCL